MSVILGSNIDRAGLTHKRKHSSISDFVSVTNANEEGFYRTIHRDGKYGISNMMLQPLGYA